VQTSSSGEKKVIGGIIAEPITRDVVVDDDYTIAPVSKENVPAVTSPRKRGRIDFNHLDGALPVLSETPQKPRNSPMAIDADEVDTPTKRRKAVPQ
jgi:hypothetical protein